MTWLLILLSYLYVIKAADWHSVPKLHDLIWRAFPAVFHIMHVPGAFITHRTKRVVKRQGFTAVSWVLHHLFLLTILNQPADVAGEMELLAVGTNRPALITVQHHAILGVGDDLIQAAVRPRVDIDIRHPFNRHPVERGRSVGTTGTFKDLPLGFRVGFLHHLASGDRTDENAFIDQEVVLRRHAVIIKAEAAGAVGFQRVGSCGKLFGAIAQVAEVFQADKRTILFQFCIESRKEQLRRALCSSCFLAIVPMVVNYQQT